MLNPLTCLLLIMWTQSACSFFLHCKTDMKNGEFPWTHSHCSQNQNEQSRCEFQKFSPKMQEERTSSPHHTTPTLKQSTVMQCKQERICKRTQFWEYYFVSCEDTQEKVIYYLKHDCNQSDSIVIRQLSISLSGMDRLIHQGMRWLPSYAYIRRRNFTNTWLVSWLLIVFKLN